MARDQVSTDRLSKLLEQLISMTGQGKLHWERQRGSAHRYARWNNNLLILGPAEPLSESKTRYLFITPFDSPSCIEISSTEPGLGNGLLELIAIVEETSKNEPPTDPFAISEAELTKLTS